MLRVQIRVVLFPESWVHGLFVTQLEPGRLATVKSEEQPDKEDASRSQTKSISSSPDVGEEMAVSAKLVSTFAVAASESLRSADESLSVV